jgi:hypothetical protein
MANLLMVSEQAPEFIVDTDSINELPNYGLLIEFSQASMLIKILYVIIFISVLFALYLTNMPFFALLFCSLGVLFYGYYLFKKHLLRHHNNAIKRLLFTELDWCYMQFFDQHIIKVMVHKNTILSEHLVILNLARHPVHKKWYDYFNHYSIIITAEEVGSDTFRELKRTLRLLQFDTNETSHFT